MPLWDAGLVKAPVAAGTMLASEAPPEESPLLTDLVSHWKMDEASGTRADSHGANDLTDHNTVTQAEGKLGSAGQFTRANNEWLSCADAADLSGGDRDFTFACWVWLDGKTNLITIVDKNDGTDWEYTLYYNNSTDRLRWFCDGPSASVDRSANVFGSPPTGQWIFIVAWHDSTNNVIGIQINNGTANTSAFDGGVRDTTGMFTVGNDGSSWDGRIDSLSRWNRLLTADEKTALYNGGAGLEYPFS